MSPSTAKAEELTADAREALVRYLASIFPDQKRPALLNIANHQIAFLEGEGFKIVPVVN